MNLAMNPMQPNPRSNLTEMYPGIYQPGHGDERNDGPNLPTAPLNTLLGFELETYQVPLDQLLPSKKVPDGVMSTRKYKQIVSSINEVGLIEPLSILHPDAKKSEYLLLDGHLRVLALKELGLHEAPCLFAKDDETYTYNHRVNRLSTIQEHYMIRRAIDRGVSKERLARAFNVNLSSINRRINLLEGIWQSSRITGKPRVGANGTEFRVLAEQVSRDRTFGQTVLRVNGRGRHALLDAPYAAVQSFNNPQARTHQQLFDDVLTLNGISLGWSIDYGLEAWTVPAGVFAHQGTFISALTTLARAGGAYLIPHPSAMAFKVRPLYPAAPWHWGDVTPDFILPAAAVSRESIAWKDKPAYNLRQRAAAAS